MLIHFLLLHFLGISTYITTLLFYGLVYLLLKALLYPFKDKKWYELVRKNVVVLLVLFLILEFALTFIPPLTFLNNYMEHDKGVYFSDYMRKKQCHFFQKLGFERVRFTFEEGDLPNTIRTVSNNEFTYKHLSNELGLRGELPEIEKDSVEFRIILLGDSFIEGDGAPDDSTLSVLLQKNLNEKLSDKKFTVISGGISGSNPLYNQIFYDKYLKSYNADMVLQAVFVNDLWDLYIMKKQGKMFLNEYFFAISHIYRIITFGILKQNDFSYINPPAKTAKMKLKLIEMLDSELKKFELSLLEAHVSFKTFYIPSKEDLRKKEMVLNTPNHIAVHLKYDINLLERFPDEKNPDINNFINTYYWNDDAHFKPKGYELVAEIIANNVIDWVTE